MTDESTSPSVPTGRSAGALLREARQAQGVHIAALAAAMKVTQKKLEALEADRIDELPDATFARALAQSVCRALKIDAAPVLALLPSQQFTGRLEHVSEGINEPFRDHGGRRDDGGWGRLASPVVWIPLLLLVGVFAVLMAPQGLMLKLMPAGGAASGASSSSGTSAIGMPVDGAASEPEASVVEAPAPAASAPTVVAAAAAFAASVADAAASSVSRVAAAASVEAASLAGMGQVQLHARQESWVEVQDANAKPLIARSLKAGETVFFDGTAPFRVKIGNAVGTDLTWRGQAVDLTSRTRDNVARLELK